MLMKPLMSFALNCLTAFWKEACISFFTAASSAFAATAADANSSAAAEAPSTNRLQRINFSLYTREFNIAPHDGRLLAIEYDGYSLACRIPACRRSPVLIYLARAAEISSLEV